jgi:hypothetical protein
MMDDLGKAESTNFLAATPPHPNSDTKGCEEIQNLIDKERGVAKDKKTKRTQTQEETEKKKSVQEQLNNNQ